MIRKPMLFIAAAIFAAPSIAGTGFLKGEQTSGLNKICYYEGASGAFSKTVGAANLCPQTADDGRGSSSRSSGIDNGSNRNQTSTGSTGFLSGERTSGLNKTCFYDGPRGTFTKTVGAANICPQSARQ